MRFLLICVLCLVALQTINASPVKRSTSGTGDSTTSSCSRTTPCGWLVYEPYVRTVDYYVKSPCSCSAETKCVRTSDDVSISAYVYRCRNETESEGLVELPADAGDTANDTSN